jgi:hypothetical protein
MSDKAVTTLQFWALNLLAAYAPAVFYIPGMARENLGWGFLIAPVLLALLFCWAIDTVAACVILLVFVGMLGFISAAFRRSRIAWVVVPLLVGLYSLSQGLMGAEILHGIDAIGHS